MDNKSQMFPEDRARIKIDKQLRDAGWDVVSRDEYVETNPLAVKEALILGNLESDYLLFVEGKAIAVIEAKAETNPLGKEVEQQAENYAHNPESWYGQWIGGLVPLVYLANGKKILFRNLLKPDTEYVEIPEMHSPKKMLQLIGKTSEYGALPRLDETGLRQCQYDAEKKLEYELKQGKKRALAVLATGAGKTYLACLATYRLLNYTPTKRVLFLVDRNNLARQTENEFSLFNRTEKQQPLSSLYQIKRLRHNEDINGSVVISTIQKLFAVLTGKKLIDDDEDKEDEFTKDDYAAISKEVIDLGDTLTLSPDYFQFIVVDECHRSIYGKWKAVLEYFKDAKILGLTATPTPEAYSFFNKNIVEEYTYEKSVVDGVNVPSRVYRIITKITEGGSKLAPGATILEAKKRNPEKTPVIIKDGIDYPAEELDRSIINPEQIEMVLSAYRDAIYKDLYPDRKDLWEFIPKTLIFAKSDKHADEIVDAVKNVFGCKFPDSQVPDGFVQKITYSAGDSNALIREFRTEKEFRIAVTVTLVATGTDVKPLEVVLFMKDVKSGLLYTQMKGRGCRTISADRLREITPNANGKDWFMIVDAVGVTEHDHAIPAGFKKTPQKYLTLEVLLEHLAHGEYTDENLTLLRDYCATIHNTYVKNALFGRHLGEFIASFNYSPKDIAERIRIAFDSGKLPLFNSQSQENSERRNLIADLIDNVEARKKLIELKHGYTAFTTEDPDELIFAGFSKETARSTIDSFEKYIEENKDSVEALRIIYNADDMQITHSMLVDLKTKLLSYNKLFTPQYLWQNYKVLDEHGNVEELNTRQNANALTHLIQLVRFAIHQTGKLTTLNGNYLQKFNLYCGQAQRELTADQRAIMQEIAEYIANEGYISSKELNGYNTDLWRKGITAFTQPVFAAEIQTLSNFILKVS